ncbi:cytochrome b [Azospirillum humicireducens]|uniref:Cytochrome b n=1 Tax=Azospirillum humicireducens TaxID=1226968 RepID=A0A160JD99_9PROT|nr:cytochrome b [Azospirillum humicireducens]ANC90660.1 cytochrome b [Azospirillum humicireducens]
MTVTAYSPAQKSLHWLIALLIVGLYLLTFGEEFYERGHPMRATIWWLHISFGLLLLGLVIARMGLRLVRGIPALPSTMAPAERGASHLVHLGLYALMLAVPLIGVVLTWLRGDTLTFFSLFSIPSPVEADRTLGRSVKDIHELAANLILALAALHMAAALWHHLVRRDGVLGRMLPDRQADRETGLAD